MAQSKITNKKQRGYLKEQIVITCSWWKSEYADEVKGFEPSLKAYEKGVKLLTKLAFDRLMANAGIGSEKTTFEVRVPGTKLVGYLPSNPARLLSSEWGAPDNTAVDEIVQIGLFGGVVFS